MSEKIHKITAKESWNKKDKINLLAWADAEILRLEAAIEAENGTK
jgi:hypothetical protein